MNEFLRQLAIQREDDHRFYHHSRVNQTLHLLSAISFLWAYAMLFSDPAGAALVGWLVSMVSRQSGHFFFEPQGFDTVNRVSHEYKESVKVGYNLRRKVVLMAIWLAVPPLLYVAPDLPGIAVARDSSTDFAGQVGIAWLALGVLGLLYRTVHLFFVRDVMTGLVWMTKILTDPINDIRLYYRSPFHLLRGELIDPGRPAAG